MYQTNSGKDGSVLLGIKKEQKVYSLIPGGTATVYTEPDSWTVGCEKSQEKLGF